MTTRHPNLLFVREDARAMNFVNGSFHLVVDKGTLDAASSDSNESQNNVENILKEYHRVLIKDRDSFVMIFSLYGPNKWKDILLPYHNLFTLKILSVEPSTTYDKTPKHVMRTEEVGGDENEAFIILLFPANLENSLALQQVEQKSSSDDLPWQDECSIGIDVSNHSAGKIETVMCLKCSELPATFECDPCRCLCYCKKCAMKLASGGKCKRCKQFYGGMRRYHGQ
jgi:hypothetical protein